jgi:hypothetical protein
MAAGRLYPDVVMVDPTLSGRSSAGSPSRTARSGTALPTAEELAAGERVFFVKSHDLPAGSDHPAIYLVRDGRDALVSYAWFSLVLHGGLRFEDVDHERFRSALHAVMTDRRSPYGVWSQHVRAWLERPRTTVVRFEDLIERPAECVRRAVDGLETGLAYHDAPVPGFDELHAGRPRFFRRGRVGAWRDEFPPDLLQQFWREHGDGMRAAGYARPDPRSRTAVGLSRS